MLLPSQFPRYMFFMCFAFNIKSNICRIRRLFMLSLLCSVLWTAEKICIILIYIINLFYLCMQIAGTRIQSNVLFSQPNTNFYLSCLNSIIALYASTLYIIYLEKLNLYVPLGFLYFNIYYDLYKAIYLSV